MKVIRVAAVTTKRCSACEQGEVLARAMDRPLKPGDPESIGGIMFVHGLVNGMGAKRDLCAKHMVMLADLLSPEQAATWPDILKIKNAGDATFELVSETPDEN